MFDWKFTFDNGMSSYIVHIIGDHFDDAYDKAVEVLRSEVNLDTFGQADIMEVTREALDPADSFEAQRASYAKSPAKRYVV